MQSLSGFLISSSVLCYRSLFNWLGHIAVSFTNLSTPSGRINLELIAFDLPSIPASLSLATMGLGHKKREIQSLCTTKTHMCFAALFFYLRVSLISTFPFGALKESLQSMSADGRLPSASFIQNILLGVSIYRLVLKIKHNI